MTLRKITPHNIGIIVIREYESIYNTSCSLKKVMLWIKNQLNEHNIKYPDNYPGWISDLGHLLVRFIAVFTVFNKLFLSIVEPSCGRF